MRDTAIFLNGVYEDVLQDILAVQSHLPDHIMYVQPHKSQQIRMLADNPPSTDDPVRLLMSITTDLPHVHFVAEIVGWDDKRTLRGDKLRLLNRLIYALQWTEGGVFGCGPGVAKPCVNLLYVRRTQSLMKPFPVDQLTNVNDGEPPSTNRTQAGGWIYVENPTDAWLAAYL